MVKPNPEMACGMEICVNPFSCKMPCDYGDKMRSPKSMAPDCANNGGCSVEQRQRSNCLAANCPRVEMSGGISGGTIIFKAPAIVSA